MKITFSQYIQSYFSLYLPVTRNLSHNTILTYKNSLLDFICFLNTKYNVDDMLVSDISVDTIQEFIKYLKERNNNVQTINLKLTVIKSFFSYIELKSLENYDICIKIKNIKPLRGKKKTPEYLSADEIKTLLESFNTNNKRDLKKLAIISIMYDCGLRVSEVCKLKIEDINISNTIYSIVTIRDSKNYKSRTVPITKNTVINQINYIKKENKNMYNKKIKTHIFRHSKAMHMVEAGIDILSIRDFLGHSSIKSTEKYARMSAKRLQEILESNINEMALKTKKTKEEIIELEEWMKKNIK